MLETKINEGAHGYSDAPCVLTHRTIRYRLKPLTKDNASWLYQTAGACRWLWNHFLAENQVKYRWHKLGMCEKPNPNFYSFCGQLKELRKEHEWLKDTSSIIARTACMRQSLAWKEFFKGTRGYPKFHARGRGAGFDILEPKDIKISHIKGKHYHIKFPKNKSKMLLIGLSLIHI